MISLWYRVVCSVSITTYPTCLNGIVNRHDASKRWKMPQAQRPPGAPEKRFGAMGGSGHWGLGLTPPTCKMMALPLCSGSLMSTVFFLSKLITAAYSIRYDRDRRAESQPICYHASFLLGRKKQMLRNISATCQLGRRESSLFDSSPNT